MAREPKTGKKPIEQYDHKGKKRVNNPPVGLVTPELDREKGVKAYAYDPHLDPQLQWSGKAEHISFEVPTVSLHVHERIDPRTIIEAVRKKNTVNYEQISLFNSPVENPPLREAIEFYKHRYNWTNRLAGEKEGWASLAKNLKAKIDEELIEAYRGTVSLPFQLGDYRKIAVKIVDDRGIESLKIMEVA